MPTSVESSASQASVTAPLLNSLEPKSDVVDSSMQKSSKFSRSCVLDGLRSVFTNLGKSASVSSRNNSMVVIQTQRFSGGGIRPDSLVAKRHSSAVIKHGANHSKAGEPITVGNHFEVATYKPSSGLDAHSDSHMHPANYVQRGLNPEQLLRMCDFEQNVLTKEFMDTHVTSNGGEPVTAQRLKDLKAAAAKA